MYTHNISLNFSQNEKYFRQICKENENTYFMFNNLFFSENRAVYEIMWKIMAKPDRPLMAIQCGAWALHAG